jgi:hypothetical protein
VHFYRGSCLKRLTFGIVWEVLVSNVGPDTSGRDTLRRSHEPFHAISGIVFEIRPLQLPTTPTPVHYSPVISLRDAVLGV